MNLIFEDIYEKLFVDKLILKHINDVIINEELSSRVMWIKSSHGAQNLGIREQHTIYTLPFFICYNILSIFKPKSSIASTFLL